MTKRFEAIEHPSDIGIVVYGKDLKEIFANAAFGMFSLMAELSDVKTKDIFNVEVGGEDTEELLVNWLNELIYLEDAKHILFKEFEILFLDKKSLKATAKGELIKKDIHMMHRTIKAATFNGLEIKKTQAKVVFDV